MCTYQAASCEDFVVSKIYEQRNSTAFDLSILPLQSPEDNTQNSLLSFKLPQVNFKNIDFHNRAPRYTRRIEIEFNGQVFAIQAGNGAFVDGTAVS